MVEKGSQFSLSHGFTPRQWLQTASVVTLMCITLGAAWAIVQLYSQPWIRMLAVSVGLLIQYVCLRSVWLSTLAIIYRRYWSKLCRSLGLNTVTAYQRAKVSALKIVNLGMGNHVGSASASTSVLRQKDDIQVDLEPPRSQLPLASSIPVPPQTQI